jgi:hypothetical protein
MQPGIANPNVVRRNGEKEAKNFKKTILTTERTGKTKLAKIPVIPVVQASWFSL